jgi:hypothetical protein
MDVALVLTCPIKGTTSEIVAAAKIASGAGGR